ncbi:sigma-70 family RNA polymerase sigma factor [Caldibacillus lycopersici]|uniref:RNA polymerase sigma factor n=1 Tax=Perspicuibacillus lycopersici TaxID=1325689 RepID=A0AAE3ITJ1_9BACI|nr:sigma-70 family RNA polymerase sigma factor [Perspicuibacillus lycopersici]MCU9614345.1 sigma-70 family RNA polymerase sigma factor [Perspicuibacillus lycopersici]
MLKSDLQIKEKEIIFEQLMKEYGEPLARLAFTYVKDRGRAEDIVQDVFIKVFHKLHEFRGDSSIQTWLYRITVNRCHDELRSWAFRKIYVSNQGLELERTSTDQTPELKLIKKQENQQLGQALLRLPIKFREVIILFYYQDMSIETIAEVLNISASTVKTRLFRARKKLSKIIPELEMEGE